MMMEENQIQVDDDHLPKLCRYGELLDFGGRGHIQSMTLVTEAKYFRNSRIYYLKKEKEKTDKQLLYHCNIN